MGRKRRSSFSSASTDDSEDDAPPDPPVKRARQSPIAGQAPRLDQPGSSASDGPYLSAEAIAARRKAMATVLNAMPEPTKLKPTVSTDSWSHHYALQRVCPEGMKPLRDDTPTNTTFPDTLSYPPKPDGTARIVFWNINGVLTSGRKFTSDYKKSINAEYGETVQKSISKPTALQRYVEAEDPDFVCLAETKLSKDVTTAEAENQLPLLKQRFPYRFWALSTETGYAGVAIFAKYKPISSTTGLPGAPEEVHPEGRLVTLEYPKCYLLTVYVPHCGIPASLDKLARRARFDKTFRDYVHRLMAKKPVIIAGDFNVTPTDRDLRRPEYHMNRTGCVIKQERQGWFDLCFPNDLPNDALLDAWREMNPRIDGHYSYTGFSKDHRQGGEGMRIDTILASNSLGHNITDCNIRLDAFGSSDHLPVQCDLRNYCFQ